MRIGTLIHDAVQKATTQLEAQLASRNADLATATAKINELQASKKKLREALDRAKEGRK